MPELPNGTITLLHTDVQDSTPMTMRLGERYAEILATHRALLRATFAAHEGYEVDTQGDSFFVVFPRATRAITAAVTMQRVLAAEPWPQGGAVQVRIGMHTGEPIRTAEGYTGLDVIRGARIKDAGHGGQVLLSKSTAALTEHTLIDGLRLRDLGEYRLKGLPQPERIFQLLIPNLRADFPPLWSLHTHGSDHRSGELGRVLTTLLSCDMVGATARIVALGDRRWLDLQREYIALVRDKLARHGGEAMNIVGDEILAKFDGAGPAIRCGLAIRDAALGLKVAVKVGIHAGEVEAAEVSGITAVTCVRIRAIAQPGEVLVSSTVKELVTGSGITFTDRGTHTIKELPGEWRLFGPA
jgi:class 3 adenylate cyclase